VEAQQQNLDCSLYENTHTREVIQLFNVLTEQYVEKTITKQKNTTFNIGSDKLRTALRRRGERSGAKKQGRARRGNQMTNRLTSQSTVRRDLTRWARNGSRARKVTRKVA